MISTTDLRVWLGIDAGDTTYDKILGDLEPRAVALLQRESGRYFGAVASTTEYLAGRGTPDLWLAEVPVGDPAIPATVIQRSGPGARETTITAVDDDGYVLRTSDREARLVRKSGYVWTEGQEFEVTYDRGYAAGSEPGDVLQAVIDIVTRTFKRRGSEGLKSESIGGYSYTVLDDDGSELVISPFTQSVIRNWRRPVV